MAGHLPVPEWGSDERRGKAAKAPGDFAVLSESKPERQGTSIDKLAVLMIEDDPIDAELLERRLRGEGFALETTRVDSLDGVRRALISQRWDLVLSDHSMAGFRSSDVLAILREQDPLIPLIIVSGAIGEREVVEALHHGAASYVEKGSLSRLAPTIERVLEEAHVRRKYLSAVQQLQLVRAAVDSANDLICVLELCEHHLPKVLYVNEPAERLTGYRSTELMARGFSALHGPLTDSDTIEQLLQAMARGEAFTTEILHYRKDGSTNWVETAIQPLPDGSHRFISVSRDITERKFTEAHLAFLAMHDPLTHLANRLLLVEHLELALARTRRSAERVAVLLIDLDGFKVINDTYGHSLGDELLCEVARRLCAAVRESDTVARVGGDEFVVVATGIVSRALAVEIATRVLAHICEPYVLTGQPIPLSLSASIGISVTATDGSDSEALIRSADIAMYRAKGRGGHTFEFASPPVS